LIIEKKRDFKHEEEKKMRQCYENANKKEIMEDLG
jgi:hypothetical protein